MPRVAMGDLLIDVEIPDEYECEFDLSGALLVYAEDGTLELSSISMTPRQPDESAARAYLDANGPAPRTVRQDLALQRPDATTTLAAFGNRLLVCTHAEDQSPLSERIVSTVQLAHEPFAPPSERVQFSPMRPSHTLFFQQRRASFEEAVGWRAQMPGAARALDDFWEEFVATPPDEEDQLNTLLTCTAIAFGDLIAPLGFEWGVVCDEWGVSLGMVALRGTANVVVVPDSFVTKRWERRESRFVEHGVEAIRQQVELMRTNWQPN